MKMPIPADALDDRLAIVGRSGYGKTNAAKVMAERLLSSGARVCILDPTDAWWGLRLKPDGETPGFPVAIFGGQKGDLALNEHAGEAIGAAIAASSQSTIVSMADFVGENARRRFASAFLAALYQHNREPLHLIVDEADTLAPQKPIAPLDAEVLSRMQQIVRRGRIRGFVPYLITQRPAVLNKDVLSQADGLIAFNLTASQDRDAIGAWIEGQADKAEQRSLLATLPKLERGTAMVWLPGRGILEQADFPLSATFDSGRTPKRGEARPMAKLKPIDVEALAGKIATVQADRAANDPAALRKRIKELEAEVARKPAADLMRQDINAELKAAHADGRQQGFADGVASVADKIASAADRLKVATESMQIAQHDLVMATAKAAMPTPGIVHRQEPYTPAPQATRSTPAPSRQPSGPTADGITRPQQRILDALAWLESVGIPSVDRTRVAWLADASPKSSAFVNNLGSLSSRGFIMYPRPGDVRATDTGKAAANPVTAPLTDAELHASISAKLPRPQWAIVETLIASHPDALSRDVLASRAGASATSSAFVNNLGALRSLGLIDYPQPGHVVALPILFVE